jgi:Regulator of Vps4 activity in the MVB pathway
VCPEELRESVAGLIFAASRCGDLQELQDVRRIFASKFGRDFVEAATDLRNGCAVDPKVPSFLYFFPLSRLKRVILTKGN